VDFASSFIAAVLFFAGCFSVVAICRMKSRAVLPAHDPSVHAVRDRLPEPSSVSGSIGATRQLLDFTTGDLLLVSGAMQRLKEPTILFSEACGSVWIDELGVIVMPVVLTAATSPTTISISCPMGHGFDAAHVIGIRYFGEPDLWHANMIIFGPNSQILSPDPIDMHAFACSDEEGFVAIDLGVLSGLTPCVMELEWSGTEYVPTLRCALILAPVSLSTLVANVPGYSPRVAGPRAFVRA